MTRGDRMDALHTDIYAEIGYHLGIDDGDDGACDAKNRAALGVLRLIERELADAVDLSGKIEGAWEWIARIEPHPELNGGLLSGLRDALSGRPDRCDRCHRPLPHSEAESRACVPDVPAARDEPEPAGDELPRDLWCNDRGPRVGESVTYCARIKGHAGGHRAHPSFGSVAWSVQVTTPEDKQ